MKPTSELLMKKQWNQEPIHAVITHLAALLKLVANQNLNDNWIYYFLYVASLWFGDPCQDHQ